MEGRCRLNNKVMRSIRKDSIYQCIVIDLAMLGVIEKEDCETLIGGSIPRGLVLPNGSTEIVDDTPRATVYDDSSDDSSSDSSSDSSDDSE